MSAAAVSATVAAWQLTLAVRNSISLHATWLSTTPRYKKVERSANPFE
ncbi:hypothetical protein SAMN05216174_113103 [Actinokineospora iranica]|uniref:Uncharacterized protein n=1 Tax=Actinokineospora iranica TaxID=1271860 RepID=A0A1G6VUX3_9PSEU|nr:hypothetical protein SAMN05216174_113103 [Actinokineospora iranica]